MKFKVGDKVRVLIDRYNNQGQIGTVLVANTQLSIEVGGLTGEYETIYVRNKEIELISLPINITFKDKYEHQAMQQFLFDNGCSWIYGNDTDVRDFGNLAIGVSKDKVIHNQNSVEVNKYNKDYPTFTFADRDIIKEILNTSKPITKLELNDSHTAEIDPNTETVKVGCQTFTFAKIKELASKLN